MLPVFVFGFTCHQNLFSVYNELKNPVTRRTNIVVWASIGISIFIYFGIGIFGYLMFGANVKGNILDEFTSGLAVLIAKAAISLLVLLSYPLQIHPCRASLLNVINTWRSTRSGYGPIMDLAEDIRQEDDVLYEKTPSFESYETSIAEPPSSSIDTTIYLGITMTLIMVSYIIALAVDNLTLVLGFVGATGSTTICYILPGILYLKMHQLYVTPTRVNEFEEVPKKRYGPIEIMAFMLVCLGFVVMPVCIVFLFAKGGGH